ncbi:MAG TPA: DUF3052 domain-containing protein [Gemmatimonadaceae bacterium]|nr:DUF3052 domain-containing protein [Gemmatimonadaceae bacterium]
MTVGSPAGYSGTPLPKKLGIRDGACVALLGAPEAFERTLGTLPPGATLRREGRGKADIVIWFVTKATELERRLPAVARLIEVGGLWIAWPKRASAVATDLTEDAIRDAALPLGLVDHKVCAIDATWSGLRFAWRRAR